MNDNRNLIMAVVLSAVVLFGWQYFVAGPQFKEDQARQAAAAQHEKKKPEPVSVAPPVVNTAPVHLPRAQALAQSGPRIPIHTPTLDGSLRLIGARFDDLRLKKYHETVDPKSPEIDLLTPFNTDFPYFVQFEWRGSKPNIALPSDRTPWKLVQGSVLSPGHPVTLTWDNGQGLTFTRMINVDEQYLFTISDSVTDHSDVSVTLIPYARVQRLSVPKTKSNFTTYLLHEGFVGVVEHKLQEAKYSYFDDKDFEPKQFRSTGGWLAITDKYWMAAIIPPKDESFGGEFHSVWFGQIRAYQTDYSLNPRQLTPGSTLTVTHRLFAGAKVVDILRHYENSQNVEMFDYATDWGWFWMLTRPLFWILDKIFRLVGNFGVAIILATILIRLLLFPLANTSFKSMSKMKKVQPEMERIKKRFADDQARIQQEMMGLYKREKVNPLSGCLPLLIQFPILFSFYKVQIVTIEMYHAPFFGWIRDLSAPDPTSYLNLFGLLPFAVPQTLPGFLNAVVFLLHVGVWPILMGITQWVQTKMNPAPGDPMQARMFALMPLIFTFMFATFPVGLVIYWTWNNLLSMAQQSYMMKREGVSIHLFENLKPPAFVFRLLDRIKSKVGK